MAEHAAALRHIAELERQLDAMVHENQRLRGYVQQLGEAVNVPPPPPDRVPTMVSPRVAPGN